MTLKTSESEFEKDLPYCQWFKRNRVGRFKAICCYP